MITNYTNKQNPDITPVKGAVKDNGDYVDFINYAFGFNGKDSSFIKLLPKLFAEGRNPAADTYFITDGDRILSCVGAFPIDFTICGTPVKATGIGNVAVHPRRRGNGYMKAAMNTALEGMLSDGCDMALLGGRRHRYNFFGFEKCGTNADFTITRKTVSYILPDMSPALSMKRLQKNDSEALDCISECHNTRKYRAERPRELLYDILVSWQAVPYVFYNGSSFAGWAVVKDDTVTELVAVNAGYIPDIVLLLSSLRYELHYTIPEFEKESCDKLWKFAENIYFGADLCFNIFNYEKIIGLLMKLKASYTRLADGELTVAVNSFAGPEKLRITVSEGIPSVSAAEGAPELTLSHLDAMQVFFMHGAPGKAALTPTQASWFPLPIYVFSPDNV